MMAWCLILALAGEAGAVVKVRVVPARVVPPAAGAGAGSSLAARVSLRPNLGAASPALGASAASRAPFAAAVRPAESREAFARSGPVAAAAARLAPEPRAAEGPASPSSAGRREPRPAAAGRKPAGSLKALTGAAGARDGPGDFRPSAGDGSPSLDALFDGVEVRSGLAGPRLRVDGGKAPFLGGGNFGSVYRSPRWKGLVYKVLSPGADAFLFGNQTISSLAREEHEISEALGRAGAGPRYHGSRVLGGYRVYAKQEIAGDTVEKLVRERRFGEAERALVLGLLDRMADARVRVDDMRPPNIMIGTTADDPERKAYLIDGTKELVRGSRVATLLQKRVRYSGAGPLAGLWGGASGTREEYDLFGPAERALVGELFARYGEPPPAGPEDPRLARVMIGTTHRDARRRAYYVDSDGALPLAPEPGLGRDEFRAFLEAQLVVKSVINQGNPLMGEPVFVSLRGILDEGVRRSRQKGFWERFWTALGDLLASANFPAK